MSVAETPPDKPTSDLPLQVVDRAAAGKPRRRLPRALLLVPLVIAAVATGGIVGLYFQPPGLQAVFRTFDLQPGAGTSRPIAVPVGQGVAADAPLRARAAGDVVGLGTLLPDGDVVTVALPFGAGDARIAALNVDEGDRVAAGDVLAVLDNERQLGAAVEARQTDLAVREAALAQTRTSVRASQDEARAALARAEAKARNAESELARADTLSGRGFVSDAVLDEKQAARDQAAQDVDEARATLSRYASADIEAQVDVVVAARNVDAARAALAQAERDLETAFVRAPISGTVLTVHADPGERPSADGLLNLGNIDRMMVEVEVFETLIGAVAVGDPVAVEAAALPEVLRGTVSKVGLEVGRQRLTEDDPAANTDARVVTVTVLLDEASSAVASRFTQLQVVARIDTGDDR